MERELTAGPGALIEAMVGCELQRIRVEQIGLDNGVPFIIGLDEHGTSRYIKSGFVLRILEAAA